MFETALDSTMPMAAQSLHLFFISTPLSCVFVDGITFTFQRTFYNKSVLNLKARDQIRHKSTTYQFTIQGNSDPFAAGFYYTRVLLGSPPREFHVQIDTGSELSWVNCASCNGCSSLSEVPIQLKLFNPASSSTSSLIQCIDQQCPSNNSACSAQNTTCNYNILYADRSGISGYYVADNIHLDIISENFATSSTASIVFGCTTYQHGYVAPNGQGLDGIFGFNKKNMSIVSQFSFQHIVPKNILSLPKRKR